MNRLEWSAPTSTDEANRRASGRRAYNAKRLGPVVDRRIKLIDLIQAGHSNAAIARMFNCHRSQITRDIQASTLLQLLDWRKLKRLYARMGGKKPGRKRYKHTR